MSYSFVITAPTKAEAKAATVTKFDEVVAAQPVHARDRAQALAAADAFIDLLSDDPQQDVRVSLNGSLSGQWHGSDVTMIGSAALAVGAYLIARAE